MLKKQLCMLIICSCLAQPLIHTTEQPTASSYTKDIDEQKNSAPTESIDDLDEPKDDFELEDDFLDSYVQPEPSKSQKLLALVAPVLVALLPYYLYVSGSVHAMKLRAAACYQALMRQKATNAGTTKKG